MKKIVADTSFLLAQFERKIDLPAEIARAMDGPAALVLPSGAISELSSLAGRKGKRAAGARFVLGNLGKLRQRLPVEIAQSAGKLDDWIFKFAKENRVCVATNDAPLRSRLKALGVPVIAVKGKSKLGFV